MRFVHGFCIERTVLARGSKFLDCLNCCVAKMAVLPSLIAAASSRILRNLATLNFDARLNDGYKNEIKKQRIMHHKFRHIFFTILILNSNILITHSFLLSRVVLLISSVSVVLECCIVLWLAILNLMDVVIVLALLLQWFKGGTNTRFHSCFGLFTGTGVHGAA